MPKPPEPEIIIPTETKDCSDTASSPSQRSSWHIRAAAEPFHPSPCGPCASSKKGTVNPSESSPPALESACLAWLVAWEARQERLLRRHEEALRLQVEALRREIIIAGGSPTPPRGLLHLDSTSSIAFHVQHSDPASDQPLRTPISSGAIIEELTTNKSEVPAIKKLKTVDRPEGIRLLIFRLVHSRSFGLASSALIFLYTVAVGVMAEMEMQYAMDGKDEPDWLWYVDCGFTAAFLIEVILRLISDGKFFFFGSDRKWNLFDGSVAMVGIADMCLGLHANLGFFRILRACRVVRVFKVLRTFSALRDLRLMVESLSAGVSCLGWGLVLLGSLQYVFAVVLLRGTHQFVREGSLSAASQAIMRESFCGIRCSLLSLTQAISGGRSWGEFTQPFEEVSPAFGLLFPAFMLFVIFGALNILTGIFVESTSSIARQNKELAVEEELARAQGAEGQIREFFEELDTDQSGTLSMEELTTGLQDPRVKAYFKVLQINAEDSRILFTLLDDDHSGEVSIEEFTEKCQSLRGGARAMDLAAVLKDNGKMQKQFKYLMKNVEEVSQKMRRDTKTPPPPES